MISVIVGRLLRETSGIGNRRGGASSTGFEFRMEHLQFSHEADPGIA